MSRLETVRTMSKVYLNSVEISKDEGFKVWTRPGTQVYLSKAKLGFYSEYLSLYIRYWDRGCHESEWSGRERKYTIVR